MRHYDPAHVAASKRIEAGEIGEPVIFKSLGRDKDMPPLRAYQARINGMLFYTNTIHDFDSARWLTHDEVAEVHSYGTVAIRPGDRGVRRCGGQHGEPSLSPGRDRECRILRAVPVRL